MMEGEDEDDDDGFFVPHGYLSNDEGDQSDIEGDLGLDPNVDPKDVRCRLRLFASLSSFFLHSPFSASR